MCEKGLIISYIQLTIHHSHDPQLIMTKRIIIISRTSVKLNFIYACAFYGSKCRIDFVNSKEIIKKNPKKINN